MPLYDYRCREHGIFHELATLEESGTPKSCPSCGHLSARVIMVPPEVLAMDPALRQGQAINERSRHEPIASNPEQRREAQARHEHKHGKGCGCAHTPIGKSSLFYTADGKKTFPSMRPWMISH